MKTRVPGSLLTQASTGALGTAPYFPQGWPNAELFIQLLHCTCFPLFKELYLYMLCKDKLNIIGNILGEINIFCR